MSQKTFSGVAGVIFLLVAAAHALRLGFKAEVIVDGWAVPLWASGVAVVIAAYLAYAGLKLSRRS